MFNKANQLARGKAHIDVAGDGQDAVELSDGAELEGQPADERVVKSIAGVDAKFAHRVCLQRKELASSSQGELLHFV